MSDSKIFNEEESFAFWKLWNLGTEKQETENSI